MALHAPYKWFPSEQRAEPTSLIVVGALAGSGVVAPLIVAFSLGNVMFVLGPVLVAEVTPVSQRGATLGMVNALPTLAGPLASAVMGLVVDAGAGTSNGVRNALLLAGTLVAMGAITGFVLIDPEADHARGRRFLG